MNKLVLAAVAAVLSSVAAHAATIVTNTTAPTYDGLLAAPDAVTGTFNLNLQGSVSGQFRTPWEFESNAATGFYNSVQGGGTATYDLGQNLTDFSIMWGSPDSYNRLVFINDGVDILTIAGNNAAITGAAGFQAGRGFVNVLVSDITFDKVRLESDNNAFEFSNVAPAPLPAAAWLLGSALVGMGVLGRKRARV